MHLQHKLVLALNRQTPKLRIVILFQQSQVAHQANDQFSKLTCAVAAPIFPHEIGPDEIRCELTLTKCRPWY
jgi:hypothetical protein